jgi:hypothetical protein
MKVGDNLPKDKDAKLAAGVRNNVAAAAADLVSRSKVIGEEVKQKKVAIVSGVYLLKSGKIEWTEPAKKDAAPDKGKTSTTPDASSESPQSMNPATRAAAPRFPRLRMLLGRR